MAEDNYQENELTLVDIVEFVQESWKQLVLAGVVGAMLGFGGWYFLGTYKAELLIQNNGYFHTILWRSTEKILPSLAAEMLEKKVVPENQRDLYRAMSAPSWWTKNVVPNYAITKKEAKDLAALSKDLDSAAASILSFAVYTNAASEAKAIENATQVASFLSSGSAYLAIKNLMNDFEGKSLSQAAYVQQKISATEIELTYLKERAKNLEALQKRFPGSLNVAQLVADPKDGGAKYLPLITQIIAVNSDINANKEDLERLNDQLNQVKTYKVFLDAAQPLASNGYDGLALIREFLQLEEQLRAKAPKHDVKALQNLDQIRTQFTNIELSFKNRLQVNTPPTAQKTGMLKTTATGIAIAGFLMLAYLLGRKLMGKLKPRPTSAV